MTNLTHRLEYIAPGEENIGAVCVITCVSRLGTDTSSMHLLRARFQVGSNHRDSSSHRLTKGSLALIVLWMVSGPAHAALREYRMSFDPSPSTTTVGYTLHIGEAPGAYTIDFDLGNLPASSPGGPILYALDLEDSRDLFVALRAYDVTGASSPYSNEIRVPAFVPASPAPVPEPQPEPTPEPAPAPRPEPEPVPAPVPLPAPMPVPVPTATPTSPPEPMPIPTPDPFTPNALFSDDFEDYAVGEDPYAWLDSGRGNSLDEAADLFSVGPVPGGGQGLVTASTETNIHSHYATSESAEWWDYEYSGQMRFDDPSSGIGVTLLSDYPNSDSYLRLRRWSRYPGFVLAPHSASAQDACVGQTETGVESRPDIWYRFRFRVQDEDGATRVYARVWDAREAEPREWQIDCLWTAWPAAAGRPGVWSMGGGRKMWDDLAAIEIGAPDPKPDILDIGGTLDTGPLLYSNDFEALSEGDDPIGWLDTEKGNALTVDDRLFAVGTAPGGGQALSTRSVDTNVHSHFIDRNSSNWRDYAYSGRMYFSSAASGIGVTLYSDFPESDRYLRLRRYARRPVFRLANHAENGASCVGSTNTGVSSIPGVWYAFRIRAFQENGEVRVQARVWAETKSEPAHWQVDCVTPSSGPYPEAGAPGLWSMGTGTKYWDNLKITPLPSD